MVETKNGISLEEVVSQQKRIANEAADIAGLVGAVMERDLPRLEAPDVRERAVVTYQPTTDGALEAFRKGASVYVPMQGNVEELAESIKKKLKK